MFIFSIVSLCIIALMLFHTFIPYLLEFFKCLFDFFNQFIDKNKNMDDNIDDNTDNQNIKNNVDDRNMEFETRIKKLEKIISKLNKSNYKLKGQNKKLRKLLKNKNNSENICP